MTMIGIRSAANHAPLAARRDHEHFVAQPEDGLPPVEMYAEIDER